MIAAQFSNAVLLEHMLKVLGIEVDDSWRSGILANMSAIGRAAELVMTLELDETVEAAPVYQAALE